MTIHFHTERHWPHYILSSTLRAIIGAIPDLQGYWLRYAVDNAGYVLDVQILAPSGPISVDELQTLRLYLDCSVAFSCRERPGTLPTNLVDIGLLKSVITALPLSGYRLEVDFNAQGGVVGLQLGLPA